MQESNEDIILEDFDDENGMMEMPDLRRQTTKFNEANANRISTGPLMRQFSKDIKINYTPPVTTTTPNKGVNVLMIGTGEYTTGYIDNLNSETDKGAGVVALTMFDLRKSGKTDRLALCGVNGSKFPKIREHMKRCISNHYSDIDISVETYPADDVVNPHSYIDALDQFKRGDAVIIFTPDNTHFDIALAAVQRGMHVLVTKPLVKTLEQHKLLHNAALENDVLVVTEVHKVSVHSTPLFLSICTHTHPYAPCHISIHSASTPSTKTRGIKPSNSAPSLTSTPTCLSLSISWRPSRPGRATPQVCTLPVLCICTCIIYIPVYLSYMHIYLTRPPIMSNPIYPDISSNIHYIIDRSQ